MRNLDTDFYVSFNTTDSITELSSVPRSQQSRAHCTDASAHIEGYSSPFFFMVSSFFFFEYVFSHLETFNLNLYLPPYLVVHTSNFKAYKDIQTKDSSSCATKSLSDKDGT